MMEPLGPRPWMAPGLNRPLDIDRTPFIIERRHVNGNRSLRNSRNTGQSRPWVWPLYAWLMTNSARLSEVAFGSVFS